MAQATFLTDYVHTVMILIIIFIFVSLEPLAWLSKSKDFAD